MPQNSRTGMFRRENGPDFVLSLLTDICMAYHQTFSWYTSQKGRGWLALKGRSPILFSTQVECPLEASIMDTLDALVVLFAEHLPKVKEIAPPLTTWINAKAIDERVHDAWDYVSALSDMVEQNEYAQPIDGGDVFENPLDDPKVGENHVNPDTV